MSTTCSFPPVCSSFKIDLSTWHNILGHPSDSNFDVLSDVLCFKALRNEKQNSHICHICHLAKQKHLPFKSINNICASNFELVHIATWGPFSVPTIDGYRYFLTIVDDHSRTTWIYLMKKHIGCLTCVSGFYCHG